MGDSTADLLRPGAAARCPHCRAAARPGAPWCTLCHADLRPRPEPPSRPEPAPPSPSAGGLAPSGPPAGGWPCATCGVANALSAATCAACGAGFLAALRESEAPLLELPGVGDLTRLSRGQRLGLAVGVVVAVVLLVALAGLLLS